MTLRKTMFVLAVGAALLCVAETAQAGTLNISTAKYRQGNGGEFLITEFDNYYIPPATTVMQHETDTANKDFLSYCIEWTENIALPKDYNYTIDNEAIGGGGGRDPVAGNDPVDEELALLFYAYWTGQLNDFVGISFDYDNSVAGARAADGEQLQIALWRLAGEGAVGSPAADPGSLAEDLIDLAGVLTWTDLGQAGWTGIGGVQALNLYDPDTNGNAQSQLVVVPLPRSAYLGFALLSGMGLMGLIRRRRRLQQTA